MEFAINAKQAPRIAQNEIMKKAKMKQKENLCARNAKLINMGLQILELANFVQ